ncbi:hypothetical protein ACFOQM_15050 [Paenibacillus sp. GCM10012307]|uniref:Uncharacterized protein n=1 Tax=Paenibacillus roseus TaxID=2798579 RepID=A0A934J3G1_9BACL|nr:hypothetical protein [Paenibacillus roseus]MBJ6362579.1 hypothetical protein [Paenibacillus roseus]
MKIRYVFLTIFLFSLALLLLSIYKSQNNKINFQPTIFPFDHLITYYPNSEDPLVEFTLFENAPNSKFSEKNNYEEVNLFSPSSNRRIYAELVSIGEATFKIVGKQKVYTRKLIFSIPPSNEIMSDAKLEIKIFNNDKPYLFDVGSFSFVGYSEKENVIEYLSVTSITPILKQLELISTVGIILGIDVKETLTLKTFNLNLDNYGVNQKSVFVTKESISKIRDLNSSQTLDQLAKGVYDFPKETNLSSSLGDVELTPGKYNLIIPFSVSHQYNSLYSLGGVIDYSVNNELFSNEIPANRYLKILNFEEEVLRGVLFEN